MLLQTTMDITKHHPSVYFVVFIGLIIQTAWSIWYAFTCVAIYVKWTPGSTSCSTTSCSSGKVAGLIFYATFAFYWTSQVIANVVLCTLSGGIFGGWYYVSDSVEDGIGDLRGCDRFSLVPCPLYPRLLIFVRGAVSRPKGDCC